MKILNNKRLKEHIKMTRDHHNIKVGLRFIKKAKNNYQCKWMLYLGLLMVEDKVMLG